MSSVTLIVMGQDLDPNAVSAALGMEADRTWRRGEPKRFIRPDWTVREFDCAHDDGGWKRFIPDRDRDEPLGYQLSSWVAQLRERRGALRALRQRGWIPELDCFLGGSEVLSLSNDQVRQLADLGVDLTITYAAVLE